MLAHLAEPLVLCQLCNMWYVAPAGLCRSCHHCAFCSRFEEPVVVPLVSPADVGCAHVYQWTSLVLHNSCYARKFCASLPSSQPSPNSAEVVCYCAVASRHEKQAHGIHYISAYLLEGCCGNNAWQCLAELIQCQSKI